MGKYIQHLQGHVQLSTRDFSRDYLSVINMFDYYMSRKIECNNIDRINILIEDGAEFAVGILDTNKQAFITLSTPFQEFEQLTTHQGRELLATQLLSALIEFSDQYEVEKSHFIECFNLLKEKDFFFADDLIVSKKYGREIKICFECDNTYKIYLIDTAKNVSIRFLELPLGANELLKFYVKKVTRVSPDELLIHHSNQRDYWEYHSETQAVEFHYPRAERGDAHGQYDLGVMYQKGQGVLQDSELSLYWLKKAAAQGYSRAIKLLENCTRTDCINATHKNTTHR